MDARFVLGRTAKSRNAGMTTQLLAAILVANVVSRCKPDADELIEQSGHVCSWPKTDIASVHRDVRFRRPSGHQPKATFFRRTHSSGVRSISIRSGSRGLTGFRYGQGAVSRVAPSGSGRCAGPGCGGRWSRRKAGSTTQASADAMSCEAPPHAVTRRVLVRACLAVRRCRPWSGAARSRRRHIGNRRVTASSCI